MPVLFEVLREARRSPDRAETVGTKPIPNGPLPQEWGRIPKIYCSTILIDSHRVEFLSKVISHYSLRDLQLSP